MKVNFKDVLSWIFLILIIVLLLWYMFGDSPTEVIIYSVVAGFVLVKMWNFNDRLTRVEMGTKNGFDMMKAEVRNGFGVVKRDMDLINGRLRV